MMTGSLIGFLNPERLILLLFCCRFNVSLIHHLALSGSITGQGERKRIENFLDDSCFDAVVMECFLYNCVVWAELEVDGKLGGFINHVVFIMGFQLLVMIALVLSGANLYGYFKCKVGAKESVGSVTSDFFRRQVLQSAVSLVTRENTAPQANPMSQPANVV
mgnify:FL=1